MSLVLSLFSGVGSLDEGFREVGYCVVSSGDVAFSSLYDIRRFHPPAGVFDGVIGGDPCQSHSALANLVRAKGLEPSFPDMTPGFQRIVEEARPRWFLRENVPKAPDIKPKGYDVRSFLLDHSTLDSGDGTGHEQMRRRRFWFGVDKAHWLSECPELRAFIDFALFVLPEPALSVNMAHDHLDGAEKIVRRRNSVVSTTAGPNTADKYRRQALTADQRAVPVALGGSGKRKATVSQASVNQDPVRKGRRLKATSCDGRHGHRMAGGAIGTTGGHAGNAPRYSLAEMLELQGLPKDLFDHSPLTVQGKRKLVGNAVPLPMARALAQAVRKAMGGSHDTAEAAGDGGTREAFR